MAMAGRRSGLPKFWRARSMADPRTVIIGLGYVGLPTALALAEAGHSVLGVDRDPARVAHIHAGIAPYAEPGVAAALVRARRSGRLCVADQPDVAETYIIAVPTPLGPDHQPDLSAVNAALEALAPHLRRGALLIVESTCPVGTTEALRDRLARLRPDLRLPDAAGVPADIAMAYCPERVLPGHAMVELIENPRCIGGISAACTHRAAQFYRQFVQGACTLTSARTAEFVKLAENSFRDVNIAFANELSMAADRLGVDIWEAVSLANQHPRVDILRPGPGVGGHCIAVDPWFLIQSGAGEMPLLRAARHVNHAKAIYVEHQIATHLAAHPKAQLAVLGLSFKADCADLRASPALDIATHLATEFGGRVLVVEPYVTDLPPGLAQTDARLVPLQVALHAADVIALLVDHAAFRRVPPTALQGKILYDTRGVWRAATSP